MKKLVAETFIVFFFFTAQTLPAQDSFHAPAPTPEHAWLQKLVGEWEVEGQITMDLGSEPTRYKGTDSVRAIGPYWIQAEAHLSFQDVPITGILTLSYDTEKQRFVGSWIDSMMPYQWIYEGTRNAAENSITLDTVGPSPYQPNKKAKYKEVIAIQSDDQRSFTSSVEREDGTWATLLTATYRRKPAAAPATGQASSAGSNLFTGNNRIVHFEIPATQPETLTRFYGELFGWKFYKAPIPGVEYWLCDTGSEGAGINGAVMQRQSPEQPWMNYVDVGSIDKVVEQATRLGAKVAMPKMTIQGVGAIAAIIDPQGNICGLFEMERQREP